MPSRRADLTSATWRKSSYSNSDGGQCVEVSDDFPGVVPVRDSKQPEGAGRRLRCLRVVGVRQRRPLSTSGAYASLRST